jgi:O-antigen/teichoic acid export membrane protein
MRNEFFRHSALVFGATTAANVLNYLFNFAVSRQLGVEGFAALSSLVGTLMILSVPASVLNLIVVKQTATFHAAGDAARTARLSQVLLKWSAFAALAALVCGEAVHGIIAEFLRISDDGAVTLTVVIIALGFVTPSLRGVLQGEQDFFRYSISLILESSLKVAFAIAFVYANLGVSGAMLGWAIGTSFSLVYTAWAVFRKHGSPGRPIQRLGIDFGGLLRTVFSIVLATGLLTLMSFTDVLLVKHYFNATEAGLYAAVNLTGKIVLFVVSFVPAIILPKAVVRVERGQSATALLLQAGLLNILLSGTVLTIFGAMPARVLGALAGHAFVSAAPYVFQYDAASVLLAMLTLVVNYRIAIHQFNFLYSLGVIVAAELVAITLWHQTMWDVIHILLLGNGVAVVLCLSGIRRPRLAVQEASGPFLAHSEP